MLQFCDRFATEKSPKGWAMNENTLAVMGAESWELTDMPNSQPILGRWPRVITAVED